MKKSKFKLSHLHSATLDAGYLVPFLLQPTLPNDSFRIGLSTFLRAQPMLAPLMHEVYLNTQYWYVPYRLLWDEWEDFITGGNNLSVTPTFPTITSTSEDAKVGSLWDYFGFPLEVGVEVSALPFRALAEIWNTRYRDEDLQSEVAVSLSSGVDNITNRELLSPCIAKDYFSISRPFTQRGADIFVPVSAADNLSPIFHRHRYSVFAWSSNGLSYQKGFTPQTTIKKNSEAAVAYGSASFEGIWDQMFWKRSNNLRGTMTFSDFSIPESIFSSSLAGSLTKTYVIIPTVTIVREGVTFVVTNFPLQLDIELVDDRTIPSKEIEFPSVVATQYPLSQNGNSILWNPTGNGYRFQVPVKVGGVVNNTTNPSYVEYDVTLNNSGSISVRDLREASALQRYAERSLKYGNRYEEFIQREFGVSPRDSRIQRPEYLGGGYGLLNISEVLQTAESTDTGVGTMRGHAIGAVSQRRIKFRSPEHGLIIGLLSIRPKVVYTQGVDREFLKRSRLDFFTPELANIGMQEVLTQEIYANASNKGSVFGYSDRYQEYRYHKPLVTGEFRGNLNYWNMSLEFANQPELTGEFVNMATYAENWKRPFQVQDNGAHSYICMLKNHIRAYRPIPKRAKDILK